MSTAFELHYWDPVSASTAHAFLKKAKLPEGVAAHVKALPKYVGARSEGPGPGQQAEAMGVPQTKVEPEGAANGVTGGGNGIAPVVEGAHTASQPAPQTVSQTANTNSSLLEVSIQ